MNRQTAIGLIVGTIFFFTSLSTIKDNIYYYDATVIPEVLFTAETKKHKAVMKAAEKYGEMKWYYGYDTAKNKLEHYRAQNTNNYIIALISLLGGFGLGYLGGDYLERKRRNSKTNLLP